MVFVYKEKIELFNCANKLKGLNSMIFFNAEGQIVSNCIYVRGCQIGMQGPQLCAKPRHFCKLDVATSRMAFLDINLRVLQVVTSNQTI